MYRRRSAGRRPDQRRHRPVLRRRGPRRAQWRPYDDLEAPLAGHAAARSARPRPGRHGAVHGGATGCTGRNGREGHPGQRVQLAPLPGSLRQRCRGGRPRRPPPRAHRPGGQAAGEAPGPLRPPRQSSACLPPNQAPHGANSARSRDQFRGRHERPPPGRARPVDRLTTRTGEWRSGSAPALGAGGRGFKSPLPDQSYLG